MESDDMWVHFMMMIVLRIREGYAYELPQIIERLMDTANAIDQSWLSGPANCTALGDTKTGTEFTVELMSCDQNHPLDWGDYENFVQSVAESITHVCPEGTESILVIPMAMGKVIERTPSN